VFKSRRRHEELLARCANIDAALAGLHSRLNVIDRRLATVAEVLATASQESHTHTGVILTAIAEHSRQIRALKDEHANVRHATNDLRHAIEHVPVAGARQFPSRD